MANVIQNPFSLLCLLTDGNYLAMEWLDHDLQPPGDIYARGRYVPVQVCKVGTRLLYAGSTKFSFSNLKRAINGTEFLQRKHSEQIGLLVGAELHSELRGSFQVLCVRPFRMRVNDICGFVDLFARFVVYEFHRPTGQFCSNNISCLSDDQ